MLLVSKFAHVDLARQFINHLNGLCGGLGAKLDVGGSVFIALPMTGLPIPPLSVVFTLLLYR